MTSIPGKRGLFLTTFVAAGLAGIAVSQTGPGRAAEQLAEAQAQSESASRPLQDYLNGLGFEALARREAAINSIQDRTQAEQRQREVRRRMLDLAGGVPAASGPVKVRQFGVVPDHGFRIENVVFESVPGYWVTANIYVPEGPGPFPALVIAPGHGASKASQYSWAANFSENGYLVLAMDPMGQGERMQHFDAELGASKLEPSGEHEHANQSALLVGKHIARYWFADGIRAVDYLSGRKDVDAARIGAFGCSGGGTFAAYLSALDTRIRAAVVASFITSFQELLPGRGPQDAEQTLPGFLNQGLDFADWVELSAPRAMAIVAFKDDFFPFAGAERTFREATTFFNHFGAGESLRFIGGEGGHCNLGPVTPRIVSFLDEHLKGVSGPPKDFPLRAPRDVDALLVTPHGQLALMDMGKTVEAMLRDEAGARLAVHRAVRNEGDLAALQNRVRADVRRLANVRVEPGLAPLVRVVKTESLGEGHIETIVIQSEPGIEANAVLGIPATPGRRPLLIRMEATPLTRIASDDDFTRLVKAGNVVVAFHPRGVLGETPQNPPLLALGPYMALSLRAMIVGKTLTGMRVDDTLSLLNALLVRPEIDPAAVTLYATGALGMTALHAAALDPRIAHVMVERTLLSYRMAFAAGLHLNLSELVIPDVLNHYDTVELIQAISPRRVTLINPANAMGQRLRDDEVAEELSVVLKIPSESGAEPRVRVGRRGPRDPLPFGQ